MNVALTTLTREDHGHPTARTLDLSLIHLLHQFITIHGARSIRVFDGRPQLVLRDTPFVQQLIDTLADIVWSAQDLLKEIQGGTLSFIMDVLQDVSYYRCLLSHIAN
jgi:hypothetical protein